MRRDRWKQPNHIDPASPCTAPADPGAGEFAFHAILAKLVANGVTVDPERQDHAYGRFAWIYDHDANKIKLWQPVG